MVFEFPKVEAVISEDVFVGENDINNLLKSLNLPELDTKREEIEVLTQIKNILLALKKESIVKDIDQIIENSNKILEIKKIEEECDVLEISLANLRSELDEIRDLANRNLEEEFNILNVNFNDRQFELQHSFLLNQAYDFLNEQPVSKQCLNMFSYLKKTKNYDLILEKSRLIDEIGSTKNILGKICTDLIKNDISKIEDIEQKYNLDKVMVLKLVYGMANSGIVSFDKAKGIICMRK